MNGHSHELEENFRQYINIFYTNYRPVLLQSGEGVISSQLQNMLRLAENKSEAFFEDNKSKIYLNTMVNDVMALKPAGLGALYN